MLFDAVPVAFSSFVLKYVPVDNHSVFLCWRPHPYYTFSINPRALRFPYTPPPSTFTALYTRTGSSSTPPTSRPTFR